MRLLLRAKDGDRTALELLCSRYIRRLNVWAHGRLPQWARAAGDTQDLSQETMVVVLRRLREFEPAHAGAFQGYVFRAMINRVIDEIRKAQRRPASDPLDSRVEANQPTPFEMAVGAETRASYENALLELRPDERQGIVARIELGFSWSEVAEALGKPSVPAAQMAVGRALVKLAKGMCHERGE